MNFWFSEFKKSLGISISFISSSEKAFTNIFLFKYFLGIHDLSSNVIESFINLINLSLKYKSFQFSFKAPDRHWNDSHHKHIIL